MLQTGDKSWFSGVNKYTILKEINVDETNCNQAKLLLEICIKNCGVINCKMKQ